MARVHPYAHLLDSADPTMRSYAFVASTFVASAVELSSRRQSVFDRYFTSGRIARMALRTSVEHEVLVCLVMKGSRRYLFLLLATACARPAAPPPPVAPTRSPLARARGPAAPPPVPR